MTSDTTMRIDPAALDELPKIELHVHLGGAIDERTAAQLARRAGEDPDRALPLGDGRYPARYGTFERFLDAYLAVNRFVRTPSDLELVAATFAQAQARQRVRYTEVIFTAMIYIRNGMRPSEMWSALRSGLSAGGADANIGIVVDAIRDRGPEEVEATVHLVEEADAPIVGLALTGIEESIPAREFVALRRAADRLGLGLEVHAGETGPASSVVAALDDLGADRIGHGVAAAAHPDLVERLARDGVPLEICPTSNVSTGLFPSLERHPFGTLWRAGVNVTVNSDDPPFFGTTITREIAHASTLAGLDRQGIADLQRRAARAAFADDTEKRRLLASVDAWESSTPGLSPS